MAAPKAYAINSLKNIGADSPERAAQVTAAGGIEVIGAAMQAHGKIQAIMSWGQQALDVLSSFGTGAGGGGRSRL